MNQEKVLDFVSQFARDTRHKEHLNPDTELVFKKFLATQAPLVSFEKVYPFVSNDLKKIQFRAPNQLQRYANGVLLEPGMLKQIFQDASLPKNKHYAVLEDFTKTVQPPKGTELTTFFLQAQKDKNIGKLIDTDIEGADGKLLDRIRAYKPSQEFSEHEIVREIGSMIADMQFGWVLDFDLVPVDCAMHDAMKEEDSEEKDSEGDEDQEMEISDATSYTTEHEKALRNNPVIQAFKRENKLTHQFPATKTIKQMMVSHLAPNNAHILVNIMGKRQTKDTFKDCELKERSNWTEIAESLVDHFDEPSIRKMLQTKAVQTLNACCPHDIEDGRALVKGLLALHAGHQHENVLSGTQTRRYMRRCEGSIGEDMLRAIVDAKLQN